MLMMLESMNKLTTDAVISNHVFRRFIKFSRSSFLHLTEIHLVESELLCKICSTMEPSSTNDDTVGVVVVV